MDDRRWYALGSEALHDADFQRRTEELCGEAVGAVGDEDDDGDNFHELQVEDGDDGVGDVNAKLFLPAPNDEGGIQEIRLI